MIDYSKLGPANSPGPLAPDITVPVAPSSPGSLATSASNPMLPTIPMAGAGGVQAGTTGYQTGGNPWTATQADVDSLDPSERIGRGIDALGGALFGEGAPLKGVPLLGDVLKMGGDAIHTFGTTTLVKPIEAGAEAIARVPLGWLPGGADENFDKLGAWAKTADPVVYEQWKLVNMAANADVLYGGNLKADFNIEVIKYLDDQSYESSLGHTPELVLGRVGVGSVGGALSKAIQGFLGFTINTSSRFLGESGWFDPGRTQNTYEEMKQVFDNPGFARYDSSRHSVGLTDEAKKAFTDLAAGKITEAEARAVVDASKRGRSRLDETAARYDAGLEVSEVEKAAVEMWRSGAWSRDHARDYLVVGGQSITRNPVGQIVGSVVLDPLTWATIGAGSVAKFGVSGLRAAEVAGFKAVAATGRGKLAAKVLGSTSRVDAKELVTIARDADSVGSKLAITVAAVQKDPALGPAFRIMRGLVDPFAVYKPSTVQRVTSDMLNASALTSYRRVYSPESLNDVRAIAREFGKENEIDSAIASRVKDQSETLIAKREVRNLHEEGLGEDSVSTDVGEYIAPFMRLAPREAEDFLVEHMTSVMKNTFSAADDADLAGRLAATFGNDIAYWTQRVSKMRHNTKSALHDLTYKTTEVELEAAKGQINVAAYTGDLPIGRLVLEASNTLDNVVAEQVIDDITTILKSDNPEKISIATVEWNSRVVQYPRLGNIGYATGGKEQVETLVKELKRQLDGGSLTKRAEEVELNDPALRPVRDVLDRHTMTAEPPYRPFVGVKADALPPGHGKIYRGDATQQSGAPVRGNDVIAWDDPVIPDTVYHVTTNVPAVRSSEVLKAGGSGGLGGDSADQIVSMTISKDVAEQLMSDMHLVAVAYHSPNPVDVFTGRAIDEGWGERWLKEAVFNPDGTVHPVGQKWTVGDWQNHYFNVRQGATGKQTPLIFGESLKGVSPDDIGIIAIPKEALDNGALITNFDLENGALKEIRSYGDVSLRKDDLRQAKYARDMKAFKDAETQYATDKAAWDAAQAGAPAPVAAAAPAVVPVTPATLDIAPFVSALKTLAATDQAIASKLANAAKVGTLPDAAAWMGTHYGVSDEAGALAVLKSNPDIIDRLAGVQVNGTVKRAFDKTPPAVPPSVAAPAVPPSVAAPAAVSAVPPDGVLRTFDDVQRAIAGEDTNNLFLRWTPDIEKERVPGYSSRHSVDRSYVEGGVSALPLRGIEDGFGFDTRWSQAPSGSGPRSYHLVRGEALLDTSGKRAFGASNEVLLKPESIVPIATIDRKLVDEGFDVFRGKKPVPPVLADEKPPMGFISKPPKVAKVPDELVGKELRLDDMDKIAEAMGMPARLATEDPAPEFLYRAISEEDYQSIITRGYMQSDGRMNLAKSEGTVASDSNPSWYLPGMLASDGPGVYRGRLVKIRRSEKWAKDKADGYWKTNAEIPASEIDQVSPTLRREVWTGPQERKLADVIKSLDTSSEAEVRAAYAKDIVIRDGEEWVISKSHFRQDKITVEMPPKTSEEFAAAEAKYTEDLKVWEEAKAQHDSDVATYEAEMKAREDAYQAEMKPLVEHEHAMDAHRAKMAEWDAASAHRDELMKVYDEDVARLGGRTVPETPEAKSAYDSGWRASQRTTTNDLDAAEARYESAHPEYKAVHRDGTHFAAGWMDEEAGLSKMTKEKAPVPPPDLPPKPKAPLPPTKSAPELGDQFSLNDGTIYHIYGEDPATGDWLIASGIDKATNKAKKLSSVPKSKDIHWANGKWNIGKPPVARASIKPVEPLPFGMPAPAKPLSLEVAPPAPPVPPTRPRMPSTAPVGPKRLWNVGFRPDEEVAWGTERSVVDGRWVIDRDPTISHNVDAVPGRQPFSDTTRNVLGQIVGKSKAERLNKPVESIEAFINTQRDIVTGRRLVMNMEQRYERIAFDAGIPTNISNEIFTKAREVAQLDRTTLRGLSPANVWQAVSDLIPRNLVLKDGTALNVHTVMDHLLQASEGDLRIMGVTSKLSQRMRNTIRRSGMDPVNASGQMTVTMYNRLRYYFNPMFIIQRITDAPYYSILYGVTPVGKGLLSEGNAQLRIITDNLARSGMARDFSMDMPEYATRSNFTAGIKTAMQQLGLKDSKLQQVLDAPDTIIANNMTNMLHARLGDIVKGALDNLAVAAANDPKMAAEMLQAGEVLTNSFEDWRRVYSNIAGRVLNDNEVGLRYIQDQLNAWRRHQIRADGTIDMTKLIREGERAMPNDIGAIGPIHPDDLADELGYSNAIELRRDVVGHIEKINGEFILVKGEHDIPWLEEQLRTQLGAHPDYVKRATAYFSETWDDFWHRLSLGVDQGGLDISAHYAKEAQGVIAREAQSRGMDPWEYLSGVMATNIGPESLDTAMGRLVSFLKGGPANGAPGDWGAFYRSHLDPSAQKVLMDDWAKTSGKPVGNADVPAGFTTNPHIAASGTTSTAPRDGMFHVTTAKDSVMKNGFGKVDAAQGFGSKGDAMNDGRVSILTNRARATTYRDRIVLAGKAARGEVGESEVIDYFMPLYKKAFGDKADEVIVNAAGPLASGASTPEQVYQLLQKLDGGLIGGNLDDAERAVKLTAPFVNAQAWDPNGIAMLELATKEKAAVKQGLDAGELTLLPEDVMPLGTGSADADEFFSEGIIKMLEDRVAKGPHANADVEAAIQQIAKITQATLKGTPAEGLTRTQLRDLVNAIPTSQASPFNRSHALVTSLLKAKIEDAQQDIFRLAEMQTKRSVIERSLNHPLFGLYPASYMWGKVLPETVKLLAKNPYSATYTIANVQRSIAIQREYDPELENLMGSVDRSAGAFLLDYLTPGLPWSDHQARMSPMMSGILEGKDIGAIWRGELGTISPQRWVSQVVESMNELPGAIEYLNAKPNEESQFSKGLQQLAGGAAAPAVPGARSEQQITGPTKASALAPILADDLSRLSSILLEGKDAEEE